MRRVWIEILSVECLTTQYQSPSMRRVWIEIFVQKVHCKKSPVTLHAEGVD